MTEGEGAFPDIPLSESSAGGCVDERETILFLGVFEDVGEDRLLDDWNGGPRRLVDGEGGHDGEMEGYSERPLTMLAIGVMYMSGAGCVHQGPSVHQLLDGFNLAASVKAIHR